MKHTETLLVVFAVIAVATITVSGQAPDRSGRGFLSVLKEGQRVNLKEVSGRIEITANKDLQLGQKNIELGTDFIAVEDIAGVTETRIPIYSIKSVVQIEIPKN